MTFDEYQDWTATTARYEGLLYPRLALAEEVGELLGKLAKFERDVMSKPQTIESYSEAYEILKRDVSKEAGDVLWQLSRVLADMGLSLSACAANNIIKIESRKERDKISGEGDDR